MKKLQLAWHPSALADLENILDYLNFQESFVAAKKLRSKIKSSTQKLRGHPRMGGVIPEFIEMGIRDFREIIVAPYRIFYRVNLKTVVILSVLDSRRHLEEILFDKLLL